MAASSMKIGFLGLIMIFLTISAGTGTWAKEFEKEEGITKTVSMATTLAKGGANEEGVTKTVSIATTSAKGGENEVLRWVTTIYTPKPNPLIECGEDYSPCSTGFGFYDTCCTDKGYKCFDVAASVGVCIKR